MTTESFRPVPDPFDASCPTACFSIHANADPGLMSRIVQVFAKRGLVPTRWHSSVGGPDNVLTIDLEMRGLAPEMAVRFATEMRNIWGVSLVLSSEKRSA